MAFKASWGFCAHASPHVAVTVLALCNYVNDINSEPWIACFSAESCNPSAMRQWLACMVSLSGFANDFTCVTSQLASAVLEKFAMYTRLGSISQYPYTMAETPEMEG